ncbi:unnamed protein product [Durusdinium trenchii]|uniref:Cytochrome b5 heme-binding domain-containing protein n=2 Tax=Durusdinium trenchii TaxID=1381693 RepID=A0ABP0HN84_9DINO
MMFLTITALYWLLARGTEASHAGLTADDACFGSETGACGLHALQVGLQTISPKSDREKVITIGLSGEPQSHMQMVMEPDRQTFDFRHFHPLHLGHMARKVFHDALHWQPLKGLSGFYQVGAFSQVPLDALVVAKTYPQPENMTIDAWLRDVWAQTLAASPKMRAEESYRQKVLIMGFIALTILPLLVVQIERRSKASQPFETRPQTSMKITQKELEEHCTTSSLWVSIGGVVCDVTDFLMLHPGGNEVLLQYGGQEAAEAFEEVGHSDFARQMVQEKAIGVLVDGNSSLRSGAGTSLLGRLFTKEDGFNIHKTLGISVLVHVLYRAYAQLARIPDAGFTSGYGSLALCWLSIALQSTSYFFEVPRARLLGSPMIWQEWRAHNFIFVSRHVAAFTICWAYLRWVNTSNQIASTMLDFSMFAVLYIQLYSVDVVTAYIREDKHTSLTASWPFWDGCPIWLEKTIKWYYTIAQFQASTLLIMTGNDLFGKYMVIFPFQFASFLMTLVRKGIITTKGFHAGYLWSLWMVVWLILDADWRTTIGSWVLPDIDVLQFPVMLITWLVCITIQKICMGFMTETRARRFLEARRKPLKLVAKEKVNDAFFLLKFEIPAGYTAGINPGQHVKVHVENISKNAQTWNKSVNLEEPVEELSRSYTPVSASTSPTIDLMIRQYPKEPDRGFPDGGRASTFLIEKLDIGQKMFLTGPHGHQLYFGQGRFLVGKSVITARACGAIAGGSGITPVLSTLRDIWQEGRRDIRDRDQRIMGEQAVRMDEFAVLHVTRKASEALPASWYQSAKGATDATPIRVSHVVTGDGAKAEVAGVKKCWSGKLTVEMVQQSLPAPADDVVIFVCGPQGFNESLCRPMLQKLGYLHVVMLQ